MTAVLELRSYIERLQRRVRLGMAARGSAALAAVALAATVLLALACSRLAFSAASLWSARALLWLMLALTVVLGLARPLRRATMRWAARRTESAVPQFGERLLTFTERDGAHDEPFLELLARDTLRIAREVSFKAVWPDRRVVVFAAVAVAALGALVWLIRTGPGYLGYGAAALWTGTPATPYYELRVSPGDAAVRRHGDQLITVQSIGGLSARPQLRARYAGASRWEEIAMQPQLAASGFQFLFAGVSEDLDYYVEAGPLHSRHFRLRVADVPAVRHIRVTYHHPAWMNLPDTVDDHSGDLRAFVGTEARLEILTDLPLHAGALVLDDGRQITLAAAGGNLYRGAVPIERDGVYHIATGDPRQAQRVSGDYFIEASAVQPPSVAIVRPERDYRASPIEEVTVTTQADAPFGLQEFKLHYSVNGGADRVLDLLAEKGARKASGTRVLRLESLKLVPGDVVSFYALAKDARAEARTDIAFIQAEPFEREFSQSQQAGGGGGGAADSQAQIAEREKEIIAQTWKEAGLTNASAQQAAEQAKFLSDVQGTLRAQALSLAGRLQLRELTSANEQFNSLQMEMSAAAAAMEPAAEALRQHKWNDAVPEEQKALQHLLRAEATFRRIEVAFGNAASGAGGVNSAGRDLASLFDLELDTQKNQYESGQSGSTSAQHARDVEDALRELDQLARRQSELAAQSAGNPSAEQRWQQEMLRRETEELRRQTEELQRELERMGNERGTGSVPGALRARDADARRVQQTLSRLREAEDEMRRAVDQRGGDDARRAAEQLRGATSLMGGLQQEGTSKQIDDLARGADRLAAEEQRQAAQLRRMGAARTAERPGRPGAAEDLDRMIDDRQRLADDLARLTQGVRSAEQSALSRSRSAASKLRDALSDLDQADTETRLQRSADWLRRGYGGTGNLAEGDIEASLQHLRDQLSQAQRASTENAASDASAADGALDALERIRGRLSALDPRSAAGGTRVEGGVTAAGRGGDDADAVNGGWNAGNNPALSRPVTAAGAPTREETQRTFRDQMRELGQLRRAVGNDAESRRRAEELIRAMQNLDPRRFPGNPAMVAELYARVLSDVDQLELQLRSEQGDQNVPVRSDGPAVVPSGYQGATAEYFRRLSKSNP
jgi:hypothetical protein